MTSTASIGGLATGLDTKSILAQLTQLERIPIKQLEVRQLKLRGIDKAWTQIVGKVQAVRSAVDGIRRISSWNTYYSATSSDTAAVTASVSGTPTSGAVSFTVNALARAEQQASPTGAGDTFTGLDDTVGGRNFTINFNDGTAALTLTDDGDDTLGDYVNRINTSGKPVRAQAVEVSSGVFQLVLTAKDTGVDNGFTINGLAGWTGTFTQVQAATDAEILIGGTNPLTVTRSSNTISDVIEGVTLNLKAETATAVTITTSRDVEKAVTAVKALVDAANEALAVIKDLTLASPDSPDESGPLVGDSTARSLSQRLLGSVSQIVAGLSGDYTSPSSVGVSLTRDGEFTLDESKLRAALTDDFDAVSSVFARVGTATDSRVTWSIASDATQPGTYGVTLTTAAERASKTGSAYVGPGAGLTETITVTYGSKTAIVTLDEFDDTLAEAVAKIQAEFDAEGITTLEVSASGGAIKLNTTGYGTLATFTVSTTGADPYGLDGTHAGIDAVVQFDGQTITGVGQAITSPDGNSEGMVFRVTATAAEVAGAGGSLALGNIVYTRGLGGAMSTVLGDFEGVDGNIQRTRDRITSQIELFQDRIDMLEIRVTARQRALAVKFSTLETVMSRLVSQGNWLSSQLASLGGGS